MSTKTKLVLTFDTDGIPNEFSVEINEPAVLPNNGEVIYCKWPDFIKDKEMLSKLEKQEEGQMFRAEVLYKIYTADRVTVQVLLHKDSEYKVL